MLKWDDNHYPINNGRLIEGLLESNETLETIIKETQNLFAEIRQPVRPKSGSRSRTLLERLWAPISEEFVAEDVTEIGFQADGHNIYPAWKDELDRQYDRLQEVAPRFVPVTNFGARGDGKTDSTEAFQKAFGTGGRRIYVPEGVYIVRGLKLPSWTRLVGAGKGKTIIRLHDGAPRRRTLLTNNNPLTGNRNISVESLTLDWNMERLDANKKSASGNNLSSCLTFMKVMYGWVKDVEALNPGLHCFDISSTFYSYAGDGTKAKGGSSYVWLDRVTGSGFGDDGVTTHHSDHIFISNSHFCDPGGRSHKRGFSNSNGFEIDDGSRHVWLANNSSSRCFGGVEIKAHATSSAAAGVHISGHLSVNDNRAFNFRHIGHHQPGDAESLSAYNITAQRLVAIHPIRTELYQESSPRALVVSGYRNVAINQFLFAGDPNYDYRGQTAASIQFRAGNVALANGRIQGFKNAATDISVSSGEKNVRNVLVRNVYSYNSATELIRLGADDSTIKLEQMVKAERA
ncbi:glycosyl hydrolase family 28-related protein [Planococcus sp. CAU13]|uniref:glycosyl hydrolase family 28-related protein n=1 Tax=Planococcus sp. CAU13 TaxID=1541197 RepID=UPI00052FEE85|nr:glycosyl hydrolase family 28-related protein [Planococcus sp. CAU13]